MRALVTGCAGFIGSHLTERLLRDGYEVVGIDCFSDYYKRETKEKNLVNSLKNRDFTFIEEDICDMEQYPEVDYVFHQAAQAGVRSSWGKSFEKYARNNIEATQRLLEFYKDLKVKKFVFASSSSVYGDAELPMREESILKPVSPYGVSKLAAENLCYLYFKHYGIPTISLRYFSVYGPRQRPDMAIHGFIKEIIDGKKIFIYGDGTQTRDFTFIDDVVEANILAADSDLAGEALNIGGGSRISINGLIHEIERITGNRAKVEFLEEQRGDVRDTLADTTRTKNILKWTPSVNIEKGLRDAIKK